MFTQFVKVEIIDHLANIADPTTYHFIPAIPHAGDTIILDDNTDTFTEAKVIEVVYIALAASQKPLDAYVKLFIEYVTRNGKAVQYAESE